ncbi:hypothetical protein FACS1894139_08060 [Planctomycetales bacterium]|nr:hypothetical protein FACS1894108_00580 [Planctomycetales bacterium]GHT04992.1 hypothetical protein FACS1894139_08060 [Planctomycetales bacterium]
MSNYWLSFSALLLIGGLQSYGGETRADDCDLCAELKKVEEPPCVEKAAKKCYATVKVPVAAPVAPLPVKPVAKTNCQIVEHKVRAVKTPVITYQTVAEWVDAPVLEEYEERVEIHRKMKVPVTDEVWDKNRVAGKKTTEKKIDRNRTAVCEEDGHGAVIPQKGRRDGYYTDYKTVKKYRQVPGKVLKFKRVPVTVVAERPESYTEIQAPVAPPVAAAAKTKYVKQKVQVDCATKKLPIDWNGAVMAK